MRGQRPRVVARRGCLILAQRQDFAGAAEHFKTYLKLAPGASDAATVMKQLEQVEKISASAAGKQNQ